MTMSPLSQPPQILRRLVGGAGGGEDRLAVALQDAQLVAERPCGGVDTVDPPPWPTGRRATGGLISNAPANYTKIHVPFMF